MQVFENTVLLSNVATLVLSSILSAYLFRVWYRQENRLLTDLPLVFALSFVGQSVNMFIVSIAQVGFVEMTLELFKLRTFFISLSVIPILGALLNIWLPRLQRHHLRLEGLFALYWIGTTLLSPNETLIMTLLIPLLLFFGVIMMATFIITWKTKRLQEIRSELMVFGILMGMLSQVLRIPLLFTPLFYLPDVFLAISFVGVSIAISNPWFKSEIRREVESIPIAPAAMTA